MNEEEGRISPKNLNNVFKKNGFDKVHQEITGVFEVQEFKLTPIKLDVPLITPFFLPRNNLSKYEFIPDDLLFDLLQAVQNYVKKSNRKFGVLIINSEVKNADDLVKDFSDAKVVLITKSDWELLFKEKKIDLFYDRLGLLLTKFLGLDFLSPYIPGRPARGGRFFGRLFLTNQLANGKGHFIIIGNRRIGKTSLLGEVAEQLREKENYRVVELYGGKWTSVEDVIFEFYTKLGMHKQANDSLELVRTRVINEFPRQVNIHIDEINQPLAIFIDEFDELIHIDEKVGNQLIHAFREIAGNENCQMFFAGFRKTREARESLSHPLYNFGNAKPLKPFNQNETYKMVEAPLRRLGISIDLEVADAIYQQTGGLPELIQIYCAEVVRFNNETKWAPDKQELLKTVADSDEFRTKVYLSFLANTLEIERLVCFLIIQKATDDPIEFTVNDLITLLAEKGLTYNLLQLERVIDNLKSSAVIEAATGRPRTYKFTVPQLIHYIAAADLGKEIDKLVSNPESLKISETNKK